MTADHNLPPQDAIPLASDLPTPADPYFTVRVHRATLTTLIISLVVHLLVLFAVPKPETTSGEDAGSPLGSAATPMQVRIAGQATAPTSEIIPAPAETPRPATKRSKSRRDRAPILTAPTPRTPATPPVPTPPIWNRSSRRRRHAGAPLKACRRSRRPKRPRKRLSVWRK